MDMNEPPLGFLMSHLADVLRERTAKALANFGLSPRDFGILWRLGVHGPLSQRQLGDLHQIDRTSVVALVDRLELAGLVARAVDPADRRRHALTLTERGQAVLEASGVEVSRVEAEFLAVVDAPARRSLLATLNAVLEHEAGR